MGVLVHCSNVRYAVIQASSKKDRPERLVIAYQDENCLRDLIAAPSIFGLGYESREEAMANLEGKVSDAAPSKHEPRITEMGRAIHENNGWPGAYDLVRPCRASYCVLQSALAMAIILFYSKNLISGMIRMALGASF